MKRYFITYDYVEYDDSWNKTKVVARIVLLWCMPDDVVDFLRYLRQEGGENFNVQEVAA